MYKRNENRPILHLILCMLILSSMNIAHAYEGIIWEKFELEDRITNMVDRAARSVLNRGDFYIQTDVILKAIEKPTFPDDPIKNPVRISSEGMEDQDDYIAFAKAGLEVPILEKYLRGQEFKDYFQARHQYYKNLGIESQVKSIVVTVSIDQSLPPKHIEQAETVLGELEIRIGKVLATIETEKKALKFTQAIKNEDQAQQKNAQSISDGKKDQGQYSLVDFLVYYANGIMLFLSTLLLGVILYLLMSKYQKIQKEKHDKESSVGGGKGGPSEHDDLESQNSSEVSISGELGKIEGESEDSMKRFLSYYQNSPAAAMNMIKKLVGDADHKSKIILAYLAHKLDYEVMLEMFEKYLSKTVRNNWKDIIAEVQESDIKKFGELYFGETLVKDVTGGQLFDDGEIIDMLMVMTPELGRRIIEENIEIAPTLLSCLNSDLTSKIMNLLSQDSAQKVLQIGVEFDFDKMQIKGLKDILSQYCLVEKYNPFYVHLKNMIGVVDEQREKQIFSILASKMSHESLLQIINEKFPINAYSFLSDETLKAIFKTYNIRNKVEYLVSLSDQEKNRLIELIAPEGSVARELLNFELYTLESDPLKVDELREKSFEKLTDLLGHIAGLQSNPEFESLIIKAKKDFINSLESEKFSKTLHAA